MKRQMLVRTAAVAALFVVATLSAVAQPPGDRGPGGPGGPGGPPPGGGFFGGGGILGLAMRDEVQQELQLVDEQKEKVQGLADEMRDSVREKMGDMFSQMRDLGDEERQAKFGEIRTKFTEINTEYQDKLNKVLLPHQLDRLKQIDVQSRVQRQGASALTSGDLAETLNLTDEQKEKLEKRAEEVQQELQEQIRQLQADSRKKMLDVLTPEQQAKLEKMMGDQFSLQDRFDGGFRGRFGRGGRDDGDRRGNREERNQTRNESI